MFDTTLIASNPRREAKRKLATLPAALGVHAMALGFVMVGQLWAVDQVPEMVTVPPLIVHILPPMGGGNDHPGGPPVHRVPVSHVAPLTPVQPQEIPEEIPKNTGPEPPTELTVPGSETLGPGPEDGPDTGLIGGPERELEREDPPPVGPIHIGGNVVAPIPLERPAPRYPEIARRAGIQGVVSIEAVIDEEGNVTQVRLTRDLRFGCGQAALEAVRTWKYRPATLNGHAVAVYLTISVTFQLNGVG